MSSITTSAIIAVLEDLSEDQVVGTQDVQKILECKETKALRIITEMKKTGIIVSVTGQGGVSASIFSESSLLGYIVIGILAFLLGTAVTAFCFRLKKWKKDKDTEDDVFFLKKSDPIWESLLKT